MSRLKTRVYALAGIITIGALLLYLVVWRTHSALPADTSLLTQQPCAIPCWHGLTPGKSTARDVYNAAENDSFIPADQYQKDVDPSKPRNTLYWWFTTPQDANRIVIDNSIVSSIQIVPNIPFSIEDVLKIYGIPTGVFISFENALSEGNIYVQFSLYYPPKGLIVDFSFLGGKPNASLYELSLTTLGKGFRIFPPANSLQDFVSQTTGFKGADLEKVMSTLVVTNWPGSNSVIVPPITNNTPILLLTATPSSMMADAPH